MVFRKLVDGPLTAEVARRTFVYNRETGKLYRKYVSGNLKEVGTSKGVYDGHLVVGYNNKQYPITHIIWLIEYGHFPPSGTIIEHADIDPSNNRLYNLREATQSQNMANIGVTKRSKSGIKGVSWDKARNKWAAYIGFNYKTINIGRFDSLEEAERAYQIKATELFGEDFVRGSD